MASTNLRLHQTRAFSGMIYLYQERNVSSMTKCSLLVCLYVNLQVNSVIRYLKATSGGVRYTSENIVVVRTLTNLEIVIRFADRIKPKPQRKD